METSPLASGSIGTDRDDYAICTVWNRYQTAQTVTVEIALWLADECRVMNIAQDIAVPAATGTGSTQIAGVDIPLTSGALIGFRITNSVANRRGETYVRLQLRKSSSSGFARAVLASSYITNGVPITKSSALESSISGPGMIRSVTYSAPGAGVGLTATLPALVRWRVFYLGINLITSATAANRRTYAQLQASSGTTSQVAYNNTTQAASLNINHYWGDYGAFGLVGAGAYQINLPAAGSAVLGGGRIIVNADLIDATDQFGALAVSCEEWIEV